MSIMEAAPERRTAKADAMEFLEAVLAGAPVPATEVGRMAREHNLTAKAIRSAREALGIKSGRDGVGPGAKSLWSLPRGHIDAQPIPSEEGRSKTKDGYEIIKLEPDKSCTYCGQRDGTVYLVCNPVEGGSEPLHEDCAWFLFEWLGKFSKRKSGGHGQV